MRLLFRAQSGRNRRQDCFITKSQGEPESKQKPGIGISGLKGIENFRKIRPPQNLTKILSDFFKFNESLTMTYSGFCSLIIFFRSKSSSMFEKRQFFTLPSAVSRIRLHPLQNGCDIEPIMPKFPANPAM